MKTSGRRPSKKAMKDQASRTLGEVQELAFLNARLEQSDKDFKVFLYALYHDLKAPLRAIAGFSHMLEEDYADVLDEEGRRWLGIISGNVTLLDSMLYELQCLARINTVQANWSRIDMKSMAMAMYHEVATAADTVGVNFSVEAIPDSFGDTTLMRKVWGRLLGNALETTADKAGRTISVRATAVEGGTKYLIMDNGCGFAQENRDRQFLPFAYRKSSTDYSPGDIGLATVKRIIELHLGHVGVDSEEGKGSSFWFWLPSWNTRGIGDDKGEQ